MAIGDIFIRWTIVNSKGKPFPLDGYGVSVSYETSHGVIEVPADSVEIFGNSLLWTFPRASQIYSGDYAVKLDLYSKGNRIGGVTRGNAFRIPIADSYNILLTSILDIESSGDASFYEHMGNGDIHVTGVEKAKWNSMLPKSDFDKYFTIHYKADGSIESIQAMAGFWTDSFVSAGGKGEGGGGGGGDVVGITFDGGGTIIPSTDGVLYIGENAIPMNRVDGLASALSAKQGTIADLGTIRSNASLGAEAYGLIDSDGAVIAVAEGQTRIFLEKHKADKAIHLTAEEHEEIRRWDNVGVILEGDARLTNARNASDVYAWAKNSSLAASDVPSLDASKITSGTFADARIASAAAWNAKWDYNADTIKAVKVTNAGYADSSGYATSSGSAGNSDTVDGYHASAFARTAAHNNLIAEGNEFTFASSGYNGAIHINYRTSGGTNGNITDYYFDNGKGGVLWMLSTVASNASLGATANSWGNHASQGYAKQTTIDNDSCVIAAGVADCKVAIETIERVMSAAEARTRRAIEAHKGDEERHVTFDERVILALFEPIYSGNRMTGIRINGNLQASGEITAGA